MTRKFAIDSSDGKIKLGAHNLTFRAVATWKSHNFLAFQFITNLQKPHDSQFARNWLAFNSITLDPRKINGPKHYV